MKHSADWSSIAYSKDGSSWTAMLGTVADATIQLAADQRGVAYREKKSLGLFQPPIGAAAVESAPATMLLIF